MVNVPRTHSATSIVPQHADTPTGASILPSVPASTDRIMPKTSSDSDVSGKYTTGAKTTEIGRITTCDSQVFKESAKRLRMYADAKSPRKKRLNTRAMNEFSVDTSPGPSVGKQGDSTRPPQQHYTSGTFGNQPQASNDTNWLKDMPTRSAEGTPSFAPQGIRRSYEQQARNISAFTTLHNPRPSALPEKTPLAGATTRTSIIDDRPKLYPPPNAGNNPGSGATSNYLGSLTSGEARTLTDPSEPSQAKLDTLVERMIAYARSKESGNTFQSGTSRDAEQTHPAASSLPHRQLLSKEDPTGSTTKRPDVTHSRLGFNIPISHRRTSAPSGTEHPFVTQRTDVPHSMDNPLISSKQFLNQNPRIYRDDPSRITSSLSARDHQPDLRKLAPSPEMADITGNDAQSGSEFRIHRDLLGLKHNNGLSKLSSHIRTPLHAPSNTEPIRSSLHRPNKFNESGVDGNTPSSSEPKVPSITVKSPNVSQPERAPPLMQESQSSHIPTSHIPTSQPLHPSRPQPPRLQSSRTQPLKASQTTHQPITTPPEQSGRKSSSEQEKEEDIRPASNHTQRWNELQWRAFSRSMHDSLIETGLLPAQAMRLFASMIRNLPEEMRDLSLFEVSRRLTVWQENAEKFRKR